MHIKSSSAAGCVGNEDSLSHTRARSRTSQRRPLLIAEPRGCFLSVFRLAGSSCYDRRPQLGSLKDTLGSQSRRPGVPDGGAAGSVLGEGLLLSVLRWCRELWKLHLEVLSCLLYLLGFPPRLVIFPRDAPLPLPATPFPISCQVSSWEGPGISTSAACGVSSVAHCHGQPPGLC